MVEVGSSATRWRVVHIIGGTGELKWITISATEDTREVRCSNCGYKVTYHGNKIPKRCMCCREVPETVEYKSNRFQNS